MKKKAVYFTSILFALAALIFAFQNLVVYDPNINPINMKFPQTHFVMVDPANSSNTQLGFYTLPTPINTLGAEYIVPYVCVDANNMPMKVDIFSVECTKKRKLRIGEPTVTYRTDLAWGKRYQLVENIPHFKKNILRVVNLKEFGSNASSPAEPRAFFDFDSDKGGDGYDIAEANGAYTSLIGTRDPITISNTFFFYDKDCKEEDGWISFPNNILPDVSSYVFANLISGTSLSECQERKAKQWVDGSLTLFEHYKKTPLVFTSGKKTDSISSTHFSGADTSKDLDAFEQFQFTKEYGITRWQRFNTKLGCRNSAVHFNQDPDKVCTDAALKEIIDADTLSKGCNGVNETSFFNQYFYRWSCRDWTNSAYHDIPRQPYMGLDLAFITSRNLIKRGDMAEGKIDQWSVYPGPNNTPTIVRPIKRTLNGESQNWALEASCTNCPGSSIYQDIDPRSIVADYGRGDLQIQLGASVKGLNNGHVTIAVFLYDTNLRFVETRRIHSDMAKTTSEDVLAFNFAWDFKNKPLGLIRYQIYFGKPGKYIVDDAFLALIPQTTKQLILPKPAL